MCSALLIPPTMGWGYAAMPSSPPLTTVGRQRKKGWMSFWGGYSWDLEQGYNCLETIPKRGSLIKPWLQPVLGCCDTTAENSTLPHRVSLHKNQFTLQKIAHCPTESAPTGSNSHCRKFHTAPQSQSPQATMHTVKLLSKTMSHLLGHPHTGTVRCLL